MNLEGIQHHIVIVFCNRRFSGMCQCTYFDVRKAMPFMSHTSLFEIKVSQVMETDVAQTNEHSQTNLVFHT